MNKTKNPKRLKGVVLYTVVGVMMVLLLFVMSALALAANANKIALQDYARTQTQYTARSVVESVVQQLTDKSNTSLGQSILGMSAGNKITLNMVDDTGTVNNTLPNGMGTVKSRNRICRKRRTRYKILCCRYRKKNRKNFSRSRTCRKDLNIFSVSSE